MNKLVLIALLLALLGVTSSQEPTRNSDPCFDNAATQADMNTCAAEALDKADAELNEVYQQLLRKHVGQKNLIAKLRLAQEAWVKFRDAHVGFLYSESGEDQLRAVGSVYPMCKAMELTRLTVERTKALKRMLNHQEGDVCGF